MAQLKHLAIIMDGNGRWAHSRGHNRFFGHVRGAKVARFIIEECARLKLECLTLFTFSTENWRRPEPEVKFLMKLLALRLRRERPTLISNNIRFSIVGDLDSLPEFVQQEVHQTIRATAACSGMKLVFALSYGGRQDLVMAARKLAKSVQRGEIRAEDINESLMTSALSTEGLPDPDLIIRTSGESRISNFYLWQAAYSELLIIEKPWPEFSIADLRASLDYFAGKERRFGMTTAQLRRDLHVLR